MPGAGVNKLYDQITPPERLTLLIEAMARRDGPEEERLRCSCPRKAYTGPDHGFASRLTMAFETVSVVTVDLRCMWGKLHMLDWVTKEVVPQLATALNVTAGLSFVEGEYWGQGLPQMGFFAKPLPEPRDEAAEGAGDRFADDEREDDDFDDDDEEEEGNERESPQRRADRGLRLAAVQERAEHFTACSVLALSLAAKDIAQDL